MEHGEAVKRTKRKWWVCLAAIAIALWLAFALWVYLQPKYDYEPTGDELFDQMAVLVLKNIEKVKSGDSLFEKLLEILGVQLDQQDLESLLERDFSLLEKRWKNDPRAMQLEFRRKAKNIGYLSAAETGLFTDLVGEYVGVFSKNEDIFRAFSYINWNEWWLIEEEPTLDAINLAIDADPQNAYYYYVKADYMMCLGEWEQAWDLVKRGNRTPHNYQPLPFPIKETREALPMFTTDNSKIAASMILELYDHPISVTPFFIDFIREIEVCVNLGAPIEIADDCLIMVLRLGDMDGAFVVEKWLALFLAQDMLNKTGQGLIELDNDQYAEWTKIMDTLELKLKALTSNQVLFPQYIRQITDYNWYKSPTTPDPVKSIDALMAANYAAGSMGDIFDLLDPPPFAIWARGETVGILDKAKAGAPPSP